MYRRLGNYTIVAILLFLWVSLAISCQKKGNQPESVFNTPRERIDLLLPQNNKKYQVKLNGIEKTKSNNFIDPSKPLSVEISSEGKVLFSEEIAVPESRILVFSEVLGHGLMNTSKEHLHPLKVSVPPDTYGDATILLKGLSTHPNGIAIANNQEYFLLPADLASGQLFIEVLISNKPPVTKKLSPQNTSSIFPFMEIDGKLMILPSPTTEQIAQLVNDFDTFVSFMYSSEDYPKHKSLVVEIAAPIDLVFEGRRPPTALKEGSNPITYTLEPDTPTEFQFIADHDGNRDGWMYLTIVRIYDPDKPDEPLQTLNRTGVIYGFKGNGYAMQGAGDYKFRCYKLIPQSSPDFPERSKRSTDHYPLFMEALSFKLD